MEPISREGFFKSIFTKTESERQHLASGIAENTKPLSRLEVIHLLRRSSFSVDQTLIDKYEGKSPASLVDYMLDSPFKNTSPTPPFFANFTVKNPGNLSEKAKQDQADTLGKLRGDYNLDLGAWWVGVMQQDKQSILEKMVLFWHGFLTTSFHNCNGFPAISVYLQNDLYRKNHLGNFKTLLEKITLDGAMLLYLNGNENVSESPNENYARELMELFSLGIGNYTEQDIKEAAKILTGWEVSMYADESQPYKAKFNINKFDKNAKLFMGEVFAVDYEINEENVKKNSVNKLIQTIFNKKGAVASKFLADKLYRYFVYASPGKGDQKVIADLADVLVKNNFELKPAVRTLLLSQHFFDDLNVGVQIKSPAETIIGITSHFPYIDMYTRNIMATLGLEPFGPPNVSGWKGHRTWISTKTLPQTIFYLREILSGTKDEQFGAWAAKFKDYGDVHTLTSKITELFLARPLNADRKAKFENVLLGGAPDYEWYEISKNNNLMGQRIRVLFNAIIKAPDFYLF